MGSDEKKVLSLLGAEARGGDTAEGGFSFQENMLIARVPAWLRREGFSEMVREALGDAEAKFFVPGAGMVREFVEYKNHQVAPAEFWREVGRFQELDEGAPGAYERFVLVCTGLSEGARPVAEALRRVRDPDSFYEGAEEIQSSSFDAFVEAVERAEGSREDAEFLFSKVRIESDAPDAERLALEVFGGALKEQYPETSRLSGDDVEAVFQRLRLLVKSRKNQPVMRAELEKALWSGVPDDIRADRRPVRIVTATGAVERCGAEELVFDWQEFFGGDERRYPPAEAWARMREELQATKDWIVTAGRPRRVSLGGSRRLSGSLCIGSVFSAVSGFSLEMDYRGAVWRTDEYGGVAYSWETQRAGEGQGGEIAVAVGVLKDIREDVSKFLEEQEKTGMPLLSLKGSEALSGAASANAAVAAAKDVISRALSESRLNVVLHLFIAGPAPFALLLGHRLNAVGHVQCYEQPSEGTYVPTCRFRT